MSMVANFTSTWPEKGNSQRNVPDSMALKLSAPSIIYIEKPLSIGILRYANPTGNVGNVI